MTALARMRTSGTIRFGGCRRLQDAVQVEDPVSIRRDVLLRQRKYVGQLSGRHLHDIEKIFADSQNISLTYGRGDRKTAVIDDPVALCGIHDEDCIQVIRHLLLIYLP